MVSDQKKKVLVVEDDLSLLTAISDAIMNAGLDVITAKDGLSGLTEAIKKRPDLIILDIIMPKMNGIDMLKKLRQNSWGKTALVILLSNDDDPAHIRETLKDDAADYLIKSDWRIVDIVDKINETLNI